MSFSGGGHRWGTGGTDGVTTRVTGPIAADLAGTGTLRTVNPILMAYPPLRARPSRRPKSTPFRLSPEQGAADKDRQLAIRTPFLPAIVFVGSTLFYLTGPRRRAGRFASCGPSLRGSASHGEIPPMPLVARARTPKPGAQDRAVWPIPVRDWQNDFPSSPDFCKIPHSETLARVLRPSLEMKTAEALC